MNPRTQVYNQNSQTASRPILNSLYIQSEQVKWDDNYLTNYYEDVLNVTGCEAVRQKITRFLDDSMRYILIPGCGSKTDLPRDIISSFPGLTGLDCSDWSGTALDLARKSFTHPKIRYLEKDTSQLAADEPYDAVIVVNSILSDNDLLNREMLRGCFRALKSGGKFIALFPDVLCSVELASLSTQLSEFLDETIDLKKSSVYERRQGMSQIFYSPQRLKKILNEVGFQIELEEIQRIAFDSEFFRKEYKRLYGFDDPSLCVWENMVHIRKS